MWRIVRDKGDMRYECSIRQLLLEIGAVRELSRKEDSALEETEVLEIQKAVLAFTYTFSPFRIVVLKKDDPLRDKFFAFVEPPGLPDHLFSIYVEPGAGSYVSGGLLHRSFNFIIKKSFIPILLPTGGIGVERTSAVKLLAGER